MKALKALLIDLDGTLADSLSILYAVYLGFLEQYGLKGTREEFQELNGLTLHEVMHTLVSRHKLPESAEALAEKYRTSLFSDYVNRLKLFPSAKKCLVYAKERGLKIALVTSAKKELVDLFLEKQNIASYFDEVVTADGLIKGKPSPEIYLKALEHLGVKGEEALAIEDARHGITSAIAAKIPVVRFNPEELPETEQAILHEVKDWEALQKILATFSIEHADFIVYSPRKIVVEKGAPIEISDEIEAIWVAQKKQKPLLFNGQILCANDLTDQELRGSFVEYKLLVAQLNGQKLDLTPISTSGIISNGSCILMGKRADGLNVYGGMLEAVPSGGIDPVSRIGDQIDVKRQVTEELFEETDLTEQEVKKIELFALVRDKIGGTYEVCAHIHVSRESPVSSPSGEYQELFWLPKSEVLDFIDAHKDTFIPCTKFLLVNYCTN